MNTIKIIGKTIDQPLVVGKFSKAVPAVLTGGAALYAYNDYKNEKGSKKERQKTLIQHACVLAGTVASALVATRGLKSLKIDGKTIFKGFEGLSPKYNLKEIKEENTRLIKDFLKNNPISDNAQKVLERAKTKILKTKDLKTLDEEFKENPKGLELLNNIIPEPKTITSKEIFGEIKRLSLMGLVPVTGGIAGGIIGDKITDKEWKNKVPNKIKEGAYQYLANIFLCNVGAGGALAVMEKMKIKSTKARALGMIGGIITTGILGGSAIANMISQKIIDPLLGIKSKKLYEERKPEALDIGLHADDIATVAVMSGLKWIEPALPILYSISGYRAGIGYRNGTTDKFDFSQITNWSQNFKNPFSKETFESFS